MGMKVTAFVDVLSHWCLAAQPTLDALRASLADDVELEVVLAPINDGAPVGFSNELESWFYRRGTLAYGTELDPAWCEDAGTTTGHAHAAGAAGGAFGANPHLRQLFVFLDMPALQQPEMYLGGATKMFDAEGNIAESGTRELIAKFLTAFASWIETTRQK